MILLDTHVLLWWTGAVAPSLSVTAKVRLGEEVENGDIFVSTITTWEVAQLTLKGRLKMKLNLDHWLRDVEDHSRVHFIPIDNRIAVESNRLPGDFHRDTADRFIVATARIHGMELLTADDKIRAYPHVRTIW